MKNLKGAKLLNYSEQKQVLGGILPTLDCKCICPEGFAVCGGTCADGTPPQFYGPVSEDCFDKFFPK